MSAKSYSNILGANDRVNFAIIGLNGHGKVHIEAISKMDNTRIQYLCDVDSRVLEDAVAVAQQATGRKIKTAVDIRHVIEQKDVDAISIVTPDHWHTPMALMGIQNGKHVYVEKPCCHNPREGELLVEAQEKYSDLVIQMGNEQRSAPTSIQAIKEIREGIIGHPYMGKAWYSNNRKTIGKGKRVPVPEYLDWNLWQGPAPHKSYQDIWVHYNWHWFWNWGTGEINNNGLHEIDICRWALDVEHPIKVVSDGGRYAYDDDWQFYDTQVASYKFEGEKMITWEGRSCNPLPHHGRGRGVTIHGTKGSALIDRNGYTVYDMDNKVVKELKEEKRSSTTQIVGTAYLEKLHLNNFVEAIRGKEQQHSPIAEGVKSNLLCHLGNIAQETKHTLDIDPNFGKIKGDPKAMKMWGREYEPGWKPTV